ncbi:hypothetical protein [Neorhizobium sp. JUb45]|uniref:hypothetical protein n=1 Tax=unclassified Neorhizobium TaxID=2629175 RepID=UPI001050540A|nr:hypothetical protein [Neorhizobium sp. JUb45]
MNRLLVALLNGLNGIYAILIVAGFTLASMAYSPAMAGAGWVGFFIGIVVATFTCGIIAVGLLISGNIAKIEKHMNFLVKSAEYQNDIAKMSLARQLNAAPASAPAQPSQT